MDDQVEGGGGRRRRAWQAERAGLHALQPLPVPGTPPTLPPSLSLHSAGARSSRSGSDAAPASASRSRSDRSASRSSRSCSSAPASGPCGARCASWLSVSRHSVSWTSLSPTCRDRGTVGARICVCLAGCAGDGACLCPTLTHQTRARLQLNVAGHGARHAQVVEQLAGALGRLLAGVQQALHVRGVAPAAWRQAGGRQDGARAQRHVNVHGSQAGTAGASAGRRWRRPPRGRKQARSLTSRR